MRLFAAAHRKVIAALLAVSVLAGCNPAEQGLVSRGIGTDLYTPALTEQTRELDAYVAEICRQAGIPVSGLDCQIGDGTTAKWMLFVQAGMNDIDQRCDAYLQWLDDRRRTSNALLHEIGDVQTGVEAGMTAARVASLSLAVATAAFGFARNTLTNLNSRLIFEVDHATVQTVVLSRQKEFRRTLPGVIDNRPAALYALRSYLRICLPYTIETDINNTITVLARGGTKPDSLVTASNRAARLAFAPLASRAVETVDRPPPVLKFTGDMALGAVSRAEKKLQRERLMKAQAALCLEPTGDLGPVDPPSLTRAAINEFIAGFDGAYPNTKQGLNDDQREKLGLAVRVPVCPTAGFKSPFEVGAFAAHPATRVEQVERFKEHLASVLKGKLGVADVANADTPGQIGDATRKQIAQYSALSKAGESDGDLNYNLYVCIQAELKACN